MWLKALSWYLCCEDGLEGWLERGGEEAWRDDGEEEEEEEEKGLGEGSRVIGVVKIEWGRATD